MRALTRSRMDFDEVADALYALPPAEFTADRDRRAKEARAAGDRDVSGRIQRLRRPTASAWLANLLVREQPAEIEQLLDLGQGMREAQQALAGEELLTLSRQRQQVVNALSRQARQLAARTGYQVNSAAGLELELTLHAALADESAAELLRTGRMSTALDPSSSGFGSSFTGTSAKPAGTAARATKAQKPAAEHVRRRLATADVAVRRAEKSSEHAGQAKAAAEQAVQQGAGHGQDLRGRLSELEAELNRVRAEESLSQRELRRLQRQLEGADKHADEATRRLAQARSQQERLDD